MISSKSLTINNKNGILYFTFPSLEIPGIKHAFTSKTGGVSQGIFASMNMSFSRGDNEENVLENYKRICNAIGTDYKKCVLSHQTHTTNIKIVTKADIGKGIVTERDYDNIDGLITNIKGVTLVTQFADCVGLLFYDSVKKIIATSHAGWRGTVNQIGKKTVAAMCEKFDCNPKDIRAAICPSICKDCFEVDQPVYEEFINSKIPNVKKIITKKSNGKYHIDLWEANLNTLLDAGLTKENITVTDLCTKCHPDVFFSHRFTGGKRGNLAALICLE